MAQDVDCCAPVIPFVRRQIETWGEIDAAVAFPDNDLPDRQARVEVQRRHQKPVLHPWLVVVVYRPSLVQQPPAGSQDFLLPCYVVGIGHVVGMRAVAVTQRGIGPPPLVGKPPPEVTPRLYGGLVKIKSTGVSCRQYRIRLPNGRLVYVDGIDLATNTVYEHYGDFWHGNPEVYNPDDMHPIRKISYAAVYEKTRERENELRKLGYQIVSIWEKDLLNWIKDNPLS